MKLLRDYPKEALKGKRVLVRAGLNVPLVHGMASERFRIERALETIQFLRERGAMVVLIAHIGRDPSMSLKPVSDALNEYMPVTFVPERTGESVRNVIEAMKDGDVVLLENVRGGKGEIEKDIDFAKELASFGDIYVNDAFSNSHRDHTSMTLLPTLLPSCAGLLMEKEVSHLSRALSPEHPSLCIIGGAKFETKEPLIRKFLETYDHVYLGGALANDIFRAKGFEIGRSLVSETPPPDEILFHERLLGPVDVTVERPDGQARVTKPEDVRADEKIVDIGPDSIAAVEPFVKEAAFILWNGPMGLYEGGFDDWTLALARTVAESRAHTIVGGGDTVAVIEELGLEDRFSFISTGGGAMLEFLQKGTLPGIEALRD